MKPISQEHRDFLNLMDGLSQFLTSNEFAVFRRELVRLANSNKASLPPKAVQLVGTAKSRGWQPCR